MGNPPITNDSFMNAVRRPWILLFQAPGLAMRGRVLMLTAVGLLLVAGGDALLRAPAVDHEATALQLESTWRLLAAPWTTMVEPAISLVASNHSLSLRAADAARLLLRLVVWGIIGGALLRIATLYLTRGESPDIRGALRYAWNHKNGYIGGPLLLLAGLVAVAVPLVAVRGMMQVPGLDIAAALVWPLVILAAIVATFYAIAAATGWPLLLAATATDESDAFDSVSRMFAYIYQKPFRLLAYVAATIAVGLLVAFIAQEGVAAVLLATQFAAGPATDTWAANTIQWWQTVASGLASVYLMAYLWSAASAIYLLRRRDVDGVHVDEVFIAADEFNDGLPPLTPGPTGVPTLVTPDDDAEAA